MASPRSSSRARRPSRPLRPSLRRVSGPDDALLGARRDDADGQPPRGRSARGASVACALALALAACAGGEPGPPPSFVIVLADDLGWADVGYQGSTFHRTPRIDALAAEGLVLSDAYAPSPVCSPSRAALVTGLSPARLHLTAALGPNTPTSAADLEGATGWREPVVADGLPTDLPTMATRLAAAGYATGWVGKWHLRGRPTEHGFQASLADSVNGAAPSYFSPYGIPTLSDGPAGEYLTDRLTDEAVRFVRGNRERPFLLVLSHYAPHLPLQAPQDLVNECFARVDLGAPQHNPVYAAMVERLDASVGRLRDELEALGLAESTLLVFTSDNGGFEEKRVTRGGEETIHITSNRPLREGKGRVYEGGLRVPLVLWGGPVREHAVLEQPVVLTDLAPTLLALGGAEPLPVSDGVDLGPLLRGGTLARESLAFHFPHNVFQSALRRGDEKLVWFWRGERGELYDLARDPGEAEDLSARAPARVEALRTELFEWLDAMGADRPTPP